MKKLEKNLFLMKIWNMNFSLARREIKKTER